MGSHLCKCHFQPSNSTIRAGDLTFADDDSFWDGSVRLLRLSELQLHHQRFLVPLNPAFLVIPVAAFRRELHVEAPQHASEDQAHFEVCKTVFQHSVGVPCLVIVFGVIYLLSANTATWTRREWLGGFFVVGCKIFVSEPALWGEGLWICEIQYITVSGVGAVLHICLI